MPARRDARAATAAKPHDYGQPGGRESGRVRLKRALERDRRILARLDAGETVRAVVAAEGVSIRTVYNARGRRDRPRPPKLVQGWLPGLSRASTPAPEEAPVIRRIRRERRPRRAKTIRLVQGSLPGIRDKPPRKGAS